LFFSCRLLCSFSRNPRELWVSIVEKAYMKLNGGYDFPGSNSGIDLFALTGWIPEQIFFAAPSSSAPNSSSRGTPEKVKALDHKQTEGRAWERLKSAHSFGDCLVTIATADALTAEQEQATGLVPGHAYAVLDVREAGILKMLKVVISTQFDE
jgi:calpain-7